MENKNLKQYRCIKLMMNFAIMFAMVGVCMILQGCTIKEQQDKKVQDLEFTVLQEKEIPKDVLDMIEQKKQGEFQFTKTSGPYTYIAVGYGRQKTSGYSIQVEDVYLGENAIYVKTALLGPKKDEAVSETETFPYVVVKTEAREEPVVFK